MKCNYCGQQNDENATHCSNPNCGKPLKKIEHLNPTVLEQAPLVMSGVDKKPQYGQKEISRCPKCDFPLRPDAMVCPNCNTPVQGNEQSAASKPIKQSNHRPTVIGFEDENSENTFGDGVQFATSDQKEKPKSPYKGTVNPYIQKMLETEFTLKPIKKENEKHQPEELTFSGDEVILNRKNLEQNNFSITSRTQATITAEDGKFYIVDGSDFKTTFVQAKNKTELHDGDIILMGDRMFEFHI